MGTQSTIPADAKSLFSESGTVAKNTEPAFLPSSYDRPKGDIESVLSRLEEENDASLEANPRMHTIKQKLSLSRDLTRRLGEKTRRSASAIGAHLLTGLQLIVRYAILLPLTVFGKGLRYFFAEFLCCLLLGLAIGQFCIANFANNNRPVEPETLKTSTATRLRFTMNMSITSIVVATVWICLFICSKKRGNAWYAWPILIMDVMMIIYAWLNDVIVRGGAEGDPNPAGLRCTYGLSTPVPGLCERVRDIRAISVAAIVLYSIGIVPFWIAAKLSNRLWPWR